MLSIRNVEIVCQGVSNCSKSIQVVQLISGNIRVKFCFGDTVLEEMTVWKMRLRSDNGFDRVCQRCAEFYSKEDREKYAKEFANLFAQIQG